MNKVLAFDVYGTLIDTAGVASELLKYAGDLTPQVTQVWRDKQLEYSFRRGLMQNYQDFAVCTRDALNFVNELFNLGLTAGDMQVLMTKYKVLPAFEDAVKGLQQLHEDQVRMFAFSNGRKVDVEGLLATAKIDQYFEGAVSVESIKSFKPNPAVYAHFLRETQTSTAQAWLISSNPFDVIGAISAGWKAVWVQRNEKMVFDPWEIQPTVTVKSLEELPEVFN